MNFKTKFKCVICGKITAGKIPKRGDLSGRYPRRHYVNKEICPGIFYEAEWIDIEKSLK